MDVRTLLAAKRVEAVRDRIGKFRMLRIDSGIDHGNGHVGAVGELVRFGQSKFRDRVLAGIALGQGRFLILQDITEVWLHRADIGISGKFAAHRLRCAAVGDAKQADGAAYQRKILRLQAHETMTPRQFLGLRVGERAVDLGHEFVDDAVQVERGPRNAAPRDVGSVLSRRSAGAAATGRRTDLIRASAVAIAIAAGRIDIG